jgi:hypothetical protein
MALLLVPRERDLGLGGRDRDEVRVDCCGSDGSVAFLRSEQRDVRVCCPESDRRLGVALLAQQAIERGEYIEQFVRRRIQEARIAAPSRTQSMSSAITIRLARVRERRPSRFGRQPICSASPIRIPSGPRT